ncbi:MAG: O-antigen ligase family protein [Clostridiales bacterium]|jgi:hypothetical protein|nr:O-antigen ligase family protein [Clostridiales bacterium]
MKIKNIMGYFTSGLIFKIIYLILVLVSFSSILLYIPYLKNVLVAASVLLGGIVLLYRVIHIRRFLKMKYIWLLIAFIGSYGISMLLNLKYGFLEPLQAMVWMVFQYFILFLKDPEQPREQTEKEFRIISWVYLIYMLCASILSFLQLLFNHSIMDYTKNPAQLSGLVWGRLWGAYTDPNYGSVLSIVAIFIGIYLVKCYKNIFVKILCGANAVIQVLYIAFSDSRTGLVCIAAGGAFYAYVRLIKLPKLESRKAAGRVISCITALCIMCALFILPRGIQKTYNEIIRLTTTTQTETPSAVQQIGREQDLEQDISNKRFDLWKSGFEIYRLRPVFGVSMFNAVAFAQEQLPNTFLVNNDAMIFDNLHNSFLNILLSQGIVGFVIAMIFTVLSAIYVLQGIARMRGTRENPDCVRITALASILITIVASMMFIGDVFYLNSGASFMFWNILGMLFVYFEKANSAKTGDAL